MMVVAERSFDEWCDMFPWQREDFIHRYNEYQKEQERKMKEQERNAHV